MMIVYDKINSSINIINDGMGLIKTYEYINKNGIFYSNNIYPLILFSKIKPKLNINMLMINYLLGGIHYNETPYENINFIFPYENINFIKGGINIIIQSDIIKKSNTDLFNNKRWIKNNSTEYIFNEFKNYISELDIFFNKKLIIN